MSCMRCHHAHIPSHSPTPSYMPMPSVTTVTGSTNDTNVLSPHRLTSTQCKCQWATNPESIPTPITLLECLRDNHNSVYYFWATELFGLHRRSLTPVQNFRLTSRVSCTYTELSNIAVGLLHPYKNFGSRHGSISPIFQTFDTWGFTAPFLLHPTHTMI